MLKLVEHSTNKKLGDIASTYRAGGENVFSTCPNTCPLKPEHSQGSAEIDRDYLEAVLLAVPKQGVSWTYTHFSYKQIPKPNPNGQETVINISTDTLVGAYTAIQEGYPTVMVAPSDDDSRVYEYLGIRSVRCPAEYLDHITCSNCGGKDGPLCARPFRDYVVRFTAHGTSYKKINERYYEGKENGGCYGNGGPVHLQWKKTLNQLPNGKDDGETLLDWVNQLAPGTLLRNHVLGDLGLV